MAEKELLLLLEETGIITDGDKKYLAFLRRYENNEMTDKDINNMIELVDFSLITLPNNKYQLKDENDVNLSGIEDEVFDTLQDIIVKLEIYIYDVFYR